MLHYHGVIKRLRNWKITFVFFRKRIYKHSKIMRNYSKKIQLKYFKGIIAHIMLQKSEIQLRMHVRV